MSVPRQPEGVDRERLEQLIDRAADRDAALARAEQAERRLDEAVKERDEARAMWLSPCDEHRFSSNLTEMTRCPKCSLPARLDVAVKALREIRHYKRGPVDHSFFAASRSQRALDELEAFQSERGAEGEAPS